MFRRKMSPLSSRTKNKTAVLSTCFMLVSFLAHSSTMKAEDETSVDSQRSSRHYPKSSSLPFLFFLLRHYHRRPIRYLHYHLLYFTQNSHRLNCQLSQFSSPYNYYLHSLITSFLLPQQSFLYSLQTFTIIIIIPNYHIPHKIVACRAVAMQRPRDGRIYQGRFWATAL
jgi:hypothetical protein